MALRFHHPIALRRPLSKGGGWRLHYVGLFLLLGLAVIAGCGGPESYRGSLGQDDGGPHATGGSGPQTDGGPPDAPAEDGLPADVDSASASCQNGTQDGDETDSDCGGLACGACAVNKMCRVPTDCASLSCDGVCLAPSCADGIRNGGESDEDCGGSCGGCLEKRACRINADCLSQSCTRGFCDAAPSCTDGEQNGTETDDDCGGGGASCPPCGVGKSCKANGDCVSGNCTGGFCQAAISCQNEGKDGMETAVDCGGPDCPKCKGGQACLLSRDCVSGLCTSGTCVDPPVLRVQQQSWENNRFTGDIKFRFQILNDGPAAAPALTQLKMRYWFNNDGIAPPFAFVCDWAAIIASNVQGRVVILPGPTKPNANAYLEIYFSGGVFPAPVPGTQQSNTGIIQARFHGTAFPTFDQSNDYSFDPVNTVPTDEPKLTLYLNDALVWGVEP